MISAHGVLRKKKTLTTQEDNDVASRQRAWEEGFAMSCVMTTGGQRLKGFVTLRTALYCDVVSDCNFTFLSLKMKTKPIINCKSGYFH